jgi:molybdopterin-guanine dinucleotide biosynthesis protein B
MNVCAFIAPSGSGKTTLLEKLIAEFQGRGIRVAAAKKSHHDLTWDTPGKDSFRLRSAGAAPLFLLTPKHLWLDAPLNETQQLPYVLHLAAFFKPEWLFLEGFAEVKTLPKIVLWRQGAASAAAWLEKAAVRAVVCDFAVATPLPKLSLNDPLALADFLLQTPSNFWQLSEK